jgi:hypothetical protein
MFALWFFLVTGMPKKEHVAYDLQWLQQLASLRQASAVIRAYSACNPGLLTCSEQAIM